MSKAITKAELVDLLLNLKAGSSFCTITAKTVPDMNKRNNPYYNGEDFTVRKVAQTNGNIQFSYENAVNKTLVKAGGVGDFVAQTPTWGEKVGNSCLVSYKGNMYLYMRPLNSLSVIYVDLQGNLLNTEDVKKYIRPHAPSTVEVRKWSVNNIIAITINGEDYTVI